MFISFERCSWYQIKFTTWTAAAQYMGCWSWLHSAVESMAAAVPEWCTQFY